MATAYARHVARVPSALATALTVLVIPAIYVWLRDDGKDASAA